MLDNCEHLVDACAQLVSSLLAESSRLRVLATSREGLGIPGESLFTVTPLPTTPGAVESAADARHLDAVRLFADRARAVCPGLELTDELIMVIGELCAGLDGLPLAIELAARLADTFTPSQILAQLGNRLTLLTGNSSTALARHRSLRAAIGWSYGLLTTEEQAIFRRLALLPGGLDRDSAAALCVDLGLTPDGVWHALTSLHHKCLLVPDTGGRFRMLDSLRAYGHDRLAASGELPATQDRLLTWLVGLAQSISDDAAVTLAFLRRLDRERHNLAYAVAIAEQDRDTRHPLLAHCLAMVWQRRGETREAEALLEGLLRAHPDGSTATMLALDGLVTVTRERGDYHRAKHLGEECLRLARQFGDKSMTLRTLTLLAAAQSRIGDVTGAVATLEQSVSLHRSLGQPLRLAMALNSLAWTLMLGGRLDAAARTAAEAMALLESADPSHVAPVQHTVGTIALLEGHLEQASVCYSIALLTPMLDPEHVPYNLDGLALVAARGGQPERALRLFAAVAATRAKSEITAAPWWQALCATTAASARERLSPAEAAAAAAEGAALRTDRAVSYGLGGEWPRPIQLRDGRALSPREHEVAALLVQGLTNAQIGGRLGVTPRTVASHLDHIRTKLDLPTRAHVIAWATRDGTGRFVP